MEKAEWIAREEHGSNKISVILGMGVWSYYAKLGYWLDGPYMSKWLDGRGEEKGDGNGAEGWSTSTLIARRVSTYKMFTIVYANVT